MKDVLTSIISEKSIVENYAQFSKDYASMKGKINVDGFNSTYIGVVGLGLRYYLLVLVAQYFDKHTYGKGSDHFMFEMILLNAWNQSFIKSFVIDSELFSSFEDFVKEVEHRFISE